MSSLLRITSAPRLAAVALLLVAPLARPAFAQEGEETDAEDTASSSIVDALSGDEDPAAAAREEATEELAGTDEADDAAMDDGASDELAAEETEEALDESEPTPVADAPALPEPSSKAPAIFQGGGVDPITGITLGASGPRQAAHIIIARDERAEGRHEVSLSNPLQANGKFTQHVGVSLDYLYHLREAFGFGFGGTFNYYAAQSQFTEDLIARAKQQPYTASALLLDWEGHVGIEVSPIYGKYALFDWRVVQFGFYFGAYGGLGHTKVQLRSADPGTGRGRTFGDTGLRPVGLFSAGMRMFFGQHFAVRFELRDTIYSAEVNRINGCTRVDLQGTGSGSAECNMDAFFSREADGAIAADLLKEPSSDVLHNVAFVGALSVLF